MADQFKLPRALSDEPNAPKPLRPSHQKIIENLDRWANSSELQPPRRLDGRDRLNPLRPNSSQHFARESRLRPLASCRVER